MSEGEETLRWPTNLDRAAIEKRLGQVAAKAAELGLAEISQTLFFLAGETHRFTGAKYIAGVAGCQVLGFWIGLGIIGIDPKFEPDHIGDGVVEHHKTIFCVHDIADRAVDDRKKLVKIGRRDGPVGYFK